MKPRTTTGWLILIGAGLLLLIAVAFLSIESIRVDFPPSPNPPHAGVTL